MTQGGQWLPSAAWPPAAPGCGASLGLVRLPWMAAHLGRQGCLLWSLFHGGQLRDLNKSAKWKQLGIEPQSFLPLLPSACLPVCHRAFRRSLPAGGH